jgi:hypothetical protein
MEERSGESLEGATRLIKEAASKQRVEVRIEEEQLKALLEQIRGGNPKAPAEISFVVEGREAVNLRAAGYWYAGDTCCA